MEPGSPLSLRQTDSFQRNSGEKRSLSKTELSEVDKKARPSRVLV